MNVQRVLGLGCAAALAVIVIVSLALWGIVGLTTSPTHRQLEKIPEDIPPQAPAEVPDIDVHGEGRTADKLKYWSGDISEQTEIPRAGAARVRQRGAHRPRRVAGVPP